MKELWDIFVSIGVTILLAYVLVKVVRKMRQQYRARKWAEWKRSVSPNPGFFEKDK